MVTFWSMQNFIVFLILLDMNIFPHLPPLFFNLTEILLSSINKHAETLNTMSESIPNLPQELKTTLSERQPSLMEVLLSEQKEKEAINIINLCCEKCCNNNDNKNLFLKYAQYRVIIDFSFTFMYILNDAFTNVQISHHWLLEYEKSLLVFTFFKCPGTVLSSHIIISLKN